MDVIGTLSSVLGVAGPVALDAWKASRARAETVVEARNDSALMRRLLAIELRRNTAFIDSIAPDAEQWAPACVAVAGLLDTTYLEAALLPGKANEELRASLSSVVVHVSEDDDDDVATMSVVPDVLPSLTVRASVLTALASLRTRPEGMKAMRLSVAFAPRSAPVSV